MVHWKEEVLDDVSKDLLKKLLEKNPESRLGYHSKPSSSFQLHSFVS
jgi:serine/threonine protein kinase